MRKILVIAEHLGGKLNSATARAVSAAIAVKPDAIDMLVLSDAPDAIAAAAATIEGVSKVLAVARAENAHPLAAVLAPQIAQAAAGYSHVFAPSTTFGKDLAPRVAALLGVAQVSDVMSVEAAHTFKRPIYAGNAIITVEANPAHTVVATIRTASWPAAASGGNSAPIETLGIEYRGKSRRAVPALQLPRRSKSRHRDRTAQDLSGSGGQSCNGGAGEGRRGARRT